MLEAQQQSINRNVEDASSVAIDVGLARARRMAARMLETELRGPVR